MRIIRGLDDLQSLVGQSIGTGDWLEVTQQRIDAFADATGDRQWIHCDPFRAARESPYGGTVAHGFLTLSLIPFLMESAFRMEGLRMMINYGLDRVRFPAPVKTGSRIRVQAHLQALREAAQGRQAAVRATVEIEGGDRPACVAETLLRLFF